MSRKELKRKGILERVQAGQLSLQEASERMELSYRQARRVYRRYGGEGDSGLIHKNRGRPSSRRICEDTKAKVIDLYRERYWDFGPTFFSEKLKEDEQISIHPETARLWLKESGLWQKKRKRKQHRFRRMRRGRFGELLQMDGSIHSWFAGNSEKQCLMNIVDDATSKPLALLASGETTEAALELLKRWVATHGIPMAIYVDLKSL